MWAYGYSSCTTQCVTPTPVTDNSADNVIMAGVITFLGYLFWASL
jgi:hypothetical protein